MFSGISNPFGTEKQVASVAFYSAVCLLAGRKVALGFSCAVGARIAGLMKKNAEEWNQASAQYFAQAKNDVVRDVAAVAGFVGALALVTYANEVLEEREKESQPLSYESIEKLKGAGMAYAALKLPSFILRKCANFNGCIEESILCMPVNQLIVRPSMYLLNKYLGYDSDYRFRGIGLSSLCGSGIDTREKEYHLISKNY